VNLRFAYRLDSYQQKTELAEAVQTTFETKLLHQDDRWGDSDDIQCKSKPLLEVSSPSSSTFCGQ
jgi:hypothetical protein